MDTSAGERKLDWEPVSKAFRAGDFCRATYREDGVDYEAVVVSVQGDRCLIRFLGYGNEQYSMAKDLVASWGEEFRMEQIETATQDAELESSQAEDVDSNASTLNSDREVTPLGSGKRRRGSNKRKSKAPMCPPMPPMPPTGDSDLHAMLMAWYMSGYYTGVFDAQQGNKKK